MATPSPATQASPHKAGEPAGQTEAFSESGAHLAGRDNRQFHQPASASQFVKKVVELNELKEKLKQQILESRFFGTQGQDEATGEKATDSGEAVQGAAGPPTPGGKGKPAEKLGPDDQPGHA